jgi:hypothetical protein
MLPNASIPSAESETLCQPAIAPAIPDEIKHISQFLLSAPFRDLMSIQKPYPVIFAIIYSSLKRLIYY